MRVLYVLSTTLIVIYDMLVKYPGFERHPLEVNTGKDVDQDEDVEVGNDGEDCTDEAEDGNNETAEEATDQAEDGADEAAEDITTKRWVSRSKIV